MKCLAQRLFSQCERMLNPLVVGLTPSRQALVEIDRANEIPAFNFHTLIQTVEDVRIGQPVPPIVFESFSQHLLVVVMLWKRTRNAGNPHLVSPRFLA